MCIRASMSQVREKCSLIEDAALLLLCSTLSAPVTITYRLPWPWFGSTNVACHRVYRNLIWIQRRRRSSRPYYWPWIVLNIAQENSSMKLNQRKSSRNAWVMETPVAVSWIWAALSKDQELVVSDGCWTELAKCDLSGFCQPSTIFLARA